MEKLLINALPITISEKASLLYFSLHKPKGAFPFLIKDTPQEVQNRFKSETDPDLLVYTCFNNAFEGGVPIPCDLFACETFTLKYLHFWIKSYFHKRGDVVGRSFINDTEVWVEDKAQDLPLYKTYFTYQLKVSLKRKDRTAKLTISYGGESRVAKKTIGAMMQNGLSIDCFSKIIFKGNINSIGNLNDHIKADLSSCYPKIGRKMAVLGSSYFPKAKRDSDRYATYWKRINLLLTSRLAQADFLQQIEHNCEWLNISEAHANTISKIDTGGGNYLFAGEKRHCNQIEGMRQYGPYKSLSSLNNTLILIYLREDKTRAHTLLNQLGIDSPSRYNLSQFGKINFSYNSQNDIEIYNKHNPIPDIEKLLTSGKLKSDANYFAIYLSPISKDVESIEAESVYYRVKQRLLREGIISQVVYRDNIESSSFPYHIPNITVALLAKLGGVPWKLGGQTVNELIIGVGAFKAVGSATRYIGSACCFSSDGLFKGFKAYPENNLYLLAGNVVRTIKEFVAQSGKPKRVIIHFYKEISKQELHPIEKELEQIDLQIPIVVVTINKTESSDFMVFDDHAPSKMPYCGTVVQIKEYTYLFCNNSRINDSSKMDGIKFPLKLKFWAKDSSLLTKELIVGHLIPQIYCFSGMYWKSVKRQALPITILYPELLARFYARFENPLLHDKCTELPWFL